ncbi:DUF1501 domain-containing protein [Aurantibacter crassamenti]|uniref:DUF1501 domain-containing protein n=1 Tax=Aurantibacter crassamenti TaxID=1837375 RepID=UPI001EEDF5D9|nr:DUF1501 domain-containing protein [Aurantibacter crassamenti]
MDILNEAHYRQSEYNTRRHFLKKCATGMGAVTLGSLMGGANLFANNLSAPSGGVGVPHFVPRAKHVIYLHMAGAPSQLELFDYKPELQKMNGQSCPPSLLEGKRFAFIRGVPQMLGPQSTFKQYGESRTWVSDYLPKFAEVADEVTFLKSVHTDEFNHAPAQFLMQTGSPRTGRPSMGGWVTYGLGSPNENLPGFVVLLSAGGPTGGKRLWGSGFLPTVHQGVQCKSTGTPVQNLKNPKGVDSKMRRKSVETINKINELEYQEAQDPEILTRISQYEMAYKMQTSVPKVMNIDDEPDYIQEMYGVTPGENSFANNCLLARRLVENGVRFVQLYDNGWDMHGAGPGGGVGDGLRRKCKQIDQPIAALLKDLKQRGMLEDTLIVWGGEFGRTPMMEARTGKNFLGRDHHNEAFTMWMTGGGIKRGHTHGETDEIGYSAISGKVHVHDIQATILNQLGLDHEKLTYRFQGRDFRLTDVHGHVIKDILA